MQMSGNSGCEVQVICIAAVLQYDKQTLKGCNQEKYQCRPMLVLPDSMFPGRV